MLHQEKQRADNRRVACEESLERAASEYVSRGWPVIPLAGKLPAIPWKEFQSRHPTQDQVNAWFSLVHKPPSGVGIITGRLSGLVVVDCDRQEDAHFWREQFPASPLAVETGGGGVHFYYAFPKESEVRNRAGVLSRKIDVRGEGGYATAPPSRHPCGKRYAWHAYSREESLPVFDPEWVAEKRESFQLTGSPETANVRNAVAYIGKIHAVAGEGGHNATFRAACKLRDAGLSEQEAFVVLLDWNETNASPPWSEAELSHKVRSAYLRTKSAAE